MLFFSTFDRPLKNGCCSAVLQGSIIPFPALRHVPRETALMVGFDQVITCTRDPNLTAVFLRSRQDAFKMSPIKLRGQVIQQNNGGFALL